MSVNDWDENDEYGEETAAASFDEYTEPGQTQRISVLYTKAHLVTLIGSDAGRTYPVDHEVVIGRDPSLPVVLDAADISRRHARIRRITEGEFEVEDLDSRNGTWVNSDRVFRQVLRFGDKISIGRNTILLFTYHDHLEDQLNQLQKMEAIGRLAGGIAHDFNNLLATVTMNMDFLSTLKHYDANTVRECVSDVKAASERGRDLTRQLLGFAQHGKYEERPVDISSLAYEVVRLIRRTVDRVITIELDVKRNLYVIGDYSQLHQVVMNLCVNAAEAMSGEGGHLALRASSIKLADKDALDLPPLAAGPHIRLEVSDTGPGIDDEAQKHIFEPFFTTKSPGKGSGLGLATVFGIVKHHGGLVRLISNKGKGSIFQVWLPQSEIKKPSVNSPAVDPNLSATVELNSGVILLVDDEDAVRKSCTRLLRTYGYEVIEAADGQEAVRLYKQMKETIQLVLLDVIMPNMGGEKTYEKLKEINSDIKVLIISGYSEEGKVRALLDSGANGFLQKPFDIESLRSAIAKTLSIPKKK